jgi:hypothetical protein
MSQIIKACIDRILTPDQYITAARRAIEENPANLPVVPFRSSGPGMAVGQLTELELALVTGKMWRAGRTLRVSFMDGEPEVQEKVKYHAGAWREHAEIKFDFGSYADADIRISFRHQGSWSYLGTDALGIQMGKPTMNFGWLTPDSSDDEYKRVVVHEFGHALGCIHEHQNPEGNIPWNKEVIYRYYMGPPNNWTREQVDHNLFRKYGRDITHSSVYDPKSIMHYPIPNQFTIGDFEVGWNRELSERDKDFIGKMYPREEVIVPLTVGGDAAQAVIGKHGEEDTFTFDVATEGLHTIETEGSTDVVIVLLGPNNRMEVIAEDDDSGQQFNAKIIADLSPGTYYLRVRHYWPTGTGNYTVSVSSAIANN